MKYVFWGVFFLIAIPLVFANGEQMHHEMVNIAEGTPIPSVEIKVSEDPKAGWNVQLVLDNFEFSPEQASKEHEEGKGHAHIYVDDKKLNRLYSEWYHIAELSEGTHEIRVTLNSNDHKNLAVEDKVIQDSETIHVIAEKSTMNNHEMEHEDKFSSGFTWSVALVALIIGALAGFFIKKSMV